MDFICVLSKVNTVTINDVTVDIDLSVYEKSSAETMAGKRKQMSTPQTEVAMSLFEDGVNQRGIAEILGVSQSGVSTFLKRFNQCESCENERRRGRPRNSLRCVKTDRRQSLTEITNKDF
jgi:predicted XRE-type DNA-binding protein